MKSKNQALVGAARNGHLFVVEFFLKIEGLSTEYIPLAFGGAAEEGHFSVVQYFLKQNQFREFWLDIACDSATRNGHLSIVNLIAGDLLKLYATEGSSETINHLLAKYPGISIENKQSAFEILVENHGDAKIIDTLSFEIMTAASLQAVVMIPAFTKRKRDEPAVGDEPDTKKQKTNDEKPDNDGKLTI
jgi:hypothetical protein